MNRRRVQVPGEPLDVTVILTDAAKNRVLAIHRNGDVFVLFTSMTGEPTARVMGVAEFKVFSAEVIGAYEALTDDAKIRELEKEFDD